MKRIIFFFSIISAIALSQKAWAGHNPGHIEFGVGFSYSSLAPHGEWIQLQTDIRVWRPLHIQSYWRPYQLGRWVWTDYGWYWMSDEPFGWVTYHYGRWYFDDYYGWVWVPDDVWGPAWVEWRYDNDYVGWAPLPPYATFSISFGLRYTTHWAAPVHYWNFVRYHHFGKHISHKHIVPADHTRRLIRTTRAGASYEVNDDRIINRGIDISTIEQRGRTRISKLDVQDVRERQGERITRSNKNGNTERIEVYRPSRDEMHQGIERVEARRSSRSLSIDLKKNERQKNILKNTPGERAVREPAKSENQKSQYNVQRDTRKQEQQRDQEIKSTERLRRSTPRIQERNIQQNRKEMRRELIQRYEHKQNSPPPVNREGLQKRMERPQQKTQIPQSDKSDTEKRSGRKSERRR